MTAAHEATFDTSLGTPPLAEAIDRQPLIVAANACLADVVKLMHKTAQGSQGLSLTTDALHGARSSCVLVMQDGQLLGIFTERDLVQLTALGVSLSATQICEVMHHPVLTMSERSLHDIFAALFLFRRHRIRHLAIVDEQQNLVGVVSLDSIRHVLRPANLLKIRRVAEVMTNQVITTLPDTPVATLIELMAVHQISCVVVVEPLPESNPPESNWLESDKAQRPVGIVTERDIVRFQALGLDIQRTQTQTVMSTPLFVLSPEDSLWTAHQEMEQRQVRRLVVSWDWGKKLGIVTQTSILRVFDPIEMHNVIETLQRTIQQLGLDLDQVLANAIDHDTHLPASLCSLNEYEVPNFKQLLNNLQGQIKHLVEHPELSTNARQTVLQAILSDLQQVQHSL
jgi:CBS domain-containing protein